ncbi:uncharacterized protein LOC105828494 isoform X2 [Monomorium pharaonis]|uniref:uncharacterized protein LOC105828494 isoform X2 n=1 Tax=Monomorium pharaonis TaxID=307658 RepID=UPI001746BB3B|nr:uncharacterized protein LOC105828494 isoform X2 [Monomorium pharaonis]
MSKRPFHELHVKVKRRRLVKENIEEFNSTDSSIDYTIYFLQLLQIIRSTMTELINLDTIKNNNISDKNDITCTKSVFTEKTHIDNNHFDDSMTEWSIVHFETDEEEEIENFYDLIPSSWITTAENYDKGMKMLVKLSKNLNATLYSDIEEKGKGKRMKKQIKHFDNSNKENKPKKRRNEQLMLPPFPQLMNVNKLSHQSLPNKIDKMKKSFMDKASTSKNIQKPISVSHKINVSNEIGEIPENNNYMTHQEVKSVKESFSMEMPKSKSAAITSEENPEEFSLTSTKCSANHQKCAYTSKGKVTLESIAQAICHLNVLSFKQTMRKMDRNIESFLETEAIAKKNTNKDTTVHMFDDFPLTNLEDLKKIERKLKHDETFYSKMVDALHTAIIGQSLQKQINSVFRIVLDDKLASQFNWKGQRGTKLKLSKRRITKIMIEAVAKNFPGVNETMFGRKAGAWLAQATFRIKKQNNKSEEDNITTSDDEIKNEVEDITENITEDIPENEKLTNISV